MPKRKRKVAEIQKAEFHSADLPSEIWERIVLGLDLACLIICLGLGTSDHWFCFYIKHALAEKKLLGIRRALSCISGTASTDNIFSNRRSVTSPVKNLLYCLSEPCLPVWLSRTIVHMLGTCVPLFALNSYVPIPGGFEIHGLNHVLNEPRFKFFVSVKIMQPIHVRNKNEDNKFWSTDYTIRVYQIRDVNSGFHRMGQLLFSFFKKFRFTVELYGSTSWIQGTQRLNSVFSLIMKN